MKIISRLIVRIKTATLIRLMALVITLIPIPSYCANQLIDTPEKWTIESSDNGINTYTLVKPMNGIIPLKTEMIVPYNIEQVVAVLDDNNRRNEWAENFKSSHLLEKLSLYEKYFYTRVEFPLWFEDRTAVIHVKIKVSDDLNTVTIYGKSAVHTKSDQYTTHVRAQIYDSSIKLERLKNGTRITMISYSDPKGAIPIWIVNLLKENIAINTLEKLKIQLKKNLYSQAELDVFTYRIENYKNLRSQ